MVHGRRKLFDLAKVARAPLAAEAVRRIADHPASRLHELLPWNWRKTIRDAAVAA